MTPKCPDCKRDQEDCICFCSEQQKQVIERQAAQIEMMREAIMFWMKAEGDYDMIKAGKMFTKALSTTPDQALEQFAAKVREQCAKVCDNLAENGVCHTNYPEEAFAGDCAAVIRRIKELP